VDCKACGCKMWFEGDQPDPVKGVKFPLYSCDNERCDQYGHTHSGEDVPFTESEIQKYAPFVEALGKRAFRAEPAAR
jgi:hypothetical protein